MMSKLYTFAIYCDRVTAVPVRISIQYQHGTKHKFFWNKRNRNLPVFLLTCVEKPATIQAAIPFFNLLKILGLRRLKIKLFSIYSIICRSEGSESNNLGFLYDRLPDSKSSSLDKP